MDAREDMTPAWFAAARDRMRDHLLEVGEASARDLPLVGLPDARPEAPAAPGEIRALSAAPQPDAEDLKGPVRLVLVRCIAEHEGYASVALVSEHTRMAGGTDVVLSHARTGLGHAVMVETDVVAPVWLDQLGGALGRVDRQTLIGILETEFTGVPAVAGAARGMPLAGPDDRRWAFKLAEAEDLRLLSAACTGALTETVRAESGIQTEGELEWTPDEGGAEAPGWEFESEGRHDDSEGGPDY